MLTEHSERRCDILSFGFTIAFLKPSNERNWYKNLELNCSEKINVKLKNFVENEVQPNQKKTKWTTATLCF